MSKTLFRVIHSSKSGKAERIHEANSHTASLRQPKPRRSPLFPPKKHSISHPRPPTLPPTPPPEPKGSIPLHWPQAALPQANVTSKDPSGWDVQNYTPEIAQDIITGPLHRMSHPIASLEPATDYEAKVAVENKFGWSEESELFGFYTRKGEARRAPGSGLGLLFLCLLGGVAFLIYPFIFVSYFT